MICIIGLGKIGQAVAANILNKGINVLAVDTNENLISSFTNGTFISTEPGIEDILINSYESRKLMVTSDYSTINACEAVIIAIPLLIDQNKKIIEEPFLNCINNISKYLRTGVLISIETSIPIGFSRKKVVPIIENNGKKLCRDFFLIHSPERIKSGTMLKQLQAIPKIIGGVNDESLKKGIEIYQTFFKEEMLIPVRSIETAEFIKIAGMVYRDINIALSNQIAIFANKSGIEYADIIKYINADNEANLLLPGIGVGGHCAPVYPYFLVENFKEYGMDFTLAREAREINDRMAEYAVSLIENEVSDKTALILGLGFRPNVKEDTFSTTYLLDKALRSKGFKVKVFDPTYSVDEISEKGLEGVSDSCSVRAEAVFLVTMHNEFQRIDWQRLRNSGTRFVVDGRNILDRNRLIELGLKYFAIGR